DGRRVLVVDDVITTGTAVREALETTTAAGGEGAGVVIALDRQEPLDPSQGRRSAAQALAEERGIPAVAVARRQDLLAVAGGMATLAEWGPALEAYRDRYGSSDGG